MICGPLYPLRFAPIYQYRLWGGRRLGDLLSLAMPDGPIGEAWLLSDRDDCVSLIADGPLQGISLRQLMARWNEPLLGVDTRKFSRFPLLLKFLDVHQPLSVQVHPRDSQTELLPLGESGKTEAWVVMETGSEARIDAGLDACTRARDLRTAIADGSVEQKLASFIPVVGDSVVIEAGTVHSLCDVVVFEVQQNSDVTFRLYDWNHLDPRTGQPRELQIENAMSCIDFARGPVVPTSPEVESTTPVRRERIVGCEHFAVTRMTGHTPFEVGATGACRVVICLKGHGTLACADLSYPLTGGDVYLLPAIIGPCQCRPLSEMTVLEISLGGNPSPIGLGDTLEEVTRAIVQN